jgi:RHS repeat-associated protein
MRTATKYFALVFLGLFALGSSQSWAQSSEPTDPSGNAGALKPRVETAGGYNPLNGNGTRSITDLQVNGAVGAYGLDFTRHWNSTDASFDLMQDDTDAPKPFAFGGWTHSWNWAASWTFTTSFCEPESQSCPGGVIETVYHAITINYPDGRTGKFTFTVTNVSEPNPFDPHFPPGLGASMAIDDHLMGMASDGSQFWLYLQDGGSVHFVTVPSSSNSRWRADKVIDPHGLLTQLLYDTDGNLTTVNGPDGRSLRLTWSTLSDHPRKVISAVESGSGAGLQRVEYYYGLHTFDATHKWQALIEARYVYPVDPAGQPIPSALYTYTPWLTTSSTAGWAKVGGPLLNYADDPRFEGAMNKIRYIFRGGPGGTPLCTAPNNPTPAPPGTAGPYLVMAAFPVEQELSAETGLMVSKLFLPCNGLPATGKRTEYRGAGGSRTFYYGKAAGLEPGVVYHPGNNGTSYWTPPEATPDAYTPYGYGSGFEPTKLTDFADNPATAPFDFDHPYGMHPWRRFDARGNLTQYIFQLLTSLDPSGNGRLKEIWYRGFDNANNNGTNKVSVKTFNWDNPGSSDARDANLIPNIFNHYLFSQTDELSFTTTYVRDSQRRIKRIDYPGGSSESYTYNAFNQVLTHTLPSGAVQTFEYDASGRLLRQYDSVDGYAARKEYTYDAFDRVATMQDGRARAAGAPYSVSMEYNARHQVTKVHYPWIGKMADPTVTYEYDAYGNCTAITNERGYRSTYTYDAYRRCTSYTEPLDVPAWNGTGNVASRTWNWIYDRALPSSYTSVVDASTHTSNKWRIQVEPAYNAAGDRKVSARNYDYNDRLVYEHTGGTLAFGAPMGSWSFTGPDVEMHSYEYDANGNKTKYTDPLSRMTTYEYDKRDRLIKTTEPLSRITSFEYDRVGNKTKVTFPDITTQQWLDYDAFGQPGRFMDERLYTTNLAYQWGPMKKLATVTTHRDKDAGGTENQVTTFSYDLTGRPTSTLFPDGSDEVTTYEFGQLKTFQTRKDATKTINYDARGRETSHTWSDSTPGITRTWDDANRLTSLANSNSTIAYTYDKAGQVLTESNTVAGAGGAAVLTSYRYGDGAAATLLYPNGFRLRRDYTSRGQLSATGSSDSSGNWLTKFAQYTYLADRKLDLEDNPGNGMHTKFTYDGRGFVNQINTYRASSSQPYTKRDYYRDSRDRIYAWKKGSYNTINPMENSRGDRYTYDPEGQLTAASYQALTPNTTPTGAQRTDSFAYDQLGNRQSPPNNQIASLPGPVTFNRRDNGLNQYLNWTQSAINYEANGNLFQDGWLTASFNALNQTTGIWSWRVTPSGDAVNSAYDPLGRCVTRWSGIPTPVITYLYYDGWNLIQEGPNASTADRIYAHGHRIDEIVASQYSGVWAYHHYDARGHCILLTNASGTILEQYDYDAFGKPYFYNASGALQTSSGWGNKFLFTGREWLKQVAVYDFRNRHYLPELGRFIQPDPEEFGAGDYNLYRYCHNDPVNKSDPFGLEDQAISRELDRLGSEASRNSLKEALRGKDGKERSQLVQKKEGKLSLQDKFNKGEDVEKRKHEGGRWKTVIESQKAEAKADPGYEPAAVGHVHMDKTGTPKHHSPKFSEDIDKPLARSGMPVYKVNESDPGHVYRLTPQVNPDDEPTIRLVRP